MTVCGEKVTGVCAMGKCPHIKRCCPVVWDKYGKIEPKTNEERLRQCTTEQLAEELLAWWIDGADTYTQFGLFQHEIDEAKEKIMKWLKEKHGGE